MAIVGKKKTEHQIALEESADAKEYFYKVLQAKKEGRDWARSIPLDMNVLWGDQGKIEHLRGPYDKNKSDEKKVKEIVEIQEEDDLPF